MMYFRFRFGATTRFAALLAMLAMLTPAWTTFVHSASAAPTWLRICGGGEKNAMPAKHGKSMPSCPLCLTLQQIGQGAAPPDVVTLVPPSIVLNESHVITVPFWLACAVDPQARPRAPPVHA